MRNRHKVAMVFAAGLLLAAAAHAYQATRKLEVHFSKPCLAPLTRVIAIVDGNENIQASLKGDETQTIWTGEWLHPTPTETFDAARATASLRIRGARTDCRKSYPKPDPADRTGTEVIGLFTFDCNPPAAASDITVNVDPGGLPLHYTRTVPGDGTDKSLPCTEAADLANGETILDVRFASEKLFLRIGDKAPNDPGVRIRINKSINESTSLDNRGLRNLRKIQRAKGNDSALPNFSSAAISLDEDNLENFKRIDMVRH